MKYSKNIIIYILYSFSCVYSQDDTSLVEYHWNFANLYTTINIPKYIKAKDTYYGEGIITYIGFADSSYMFLHFGGCIEIPILNYDKHIVIETNKYEHKLCNKGKVKNKNFFWREDSYSIFINIGYDNVQPNKISLYDKCLNSFTILKGP